MLLAMAFNTNAAPAHKIMREGDSIRFARNRQAPHGAPPRQLTRQLTMGC